jgi:hypothetical protein
MHSMGGNEVRERLKKEMVSSDASLIVLLSSPLVKGKSHNGWHTMYWEKV